MKTSNKVILLISAAVLGTVGYIYVQVRKLINAPFKIKGVKDINISGTNLNFTLLGQLNNEGRISAYVKDQYYDVFINDILISKVHNKDEVFVGAYKSSIIPLKVNLNYDKLIKIGLDNLTNIVADKSKVKLIIKGYFDWRAGVLSAKQPFELNYTLKEILDLNKQAATV